MKIEAVCLLMMSACVWMYVAGVEGVVGQLMRTPPPPPTATLTAASILITGAASGIGLATAMQLAGYGAHVVLACHEQSDAMRAIGQITAAHPDARVEYRPLDLSSMDSVRSFAREFKASHSKLNILINNAGIMLAPYSVSSSGFESHFQINYLAHVLLTRLLLDLIISSGSPAFPSKIINVSSCVHTAVSLDWEHCQAHATQDTYSGYAAYAESKLALLLFSYSLARRLQDKNT
eukprot:m.848335 g.848335  ORF g.848335 m.848335 type:complete len:235 (+) comp59567_c1_seq15:7149-7853(+)